VQEEITMTTMKKAAIAFLLGVIVSTTGCNTVHGVGQDVEREGEAIQSAADDAKSK
jgi:predicted small secreted protein